MIYTSYCDEQDFNGAENNKTQVNQIQCSSSKSSKQLPEKAVQLMNAWYLAHEDDPYPNRNDLDYLATNGGIKESQVKAWFSNKRNRTQNTHPKRAKRYLMRTQTVQTSTSWNEPQKIYITDQFEQQVLATQPNVYSNSEVASNFSTEWHWSTSTSYDYYHHY